MHEVTSKAAMHWFLALFPPGGAAVGQDEPADELAGFGAADAQIGPAHPIPGRMREDPN